MRRPLQVLGLACVGLMLTAGTAIWYAAFRAPSMDLRPLPDELIAAQSATGRQLLAESRFTADYPSLTKNFESQSRPAFCGVASSVVVLNALRVRNPELTQTSFFTDAVSRLRSPLRVTLGGMSLAQLADLLRAHTVEATPYYTSDNDIDAFRSIARENLQSRGDFVLVNYERAVLGQGQTGHISPLAAYNAHSDRLLILDVAAYKYPPVWVSTVELWNAMNTIDRASGRTRGFIIVRRLDGGANPRPTD